MTIKPRTEETKLCKDCAHYGGEWRRYECRHPNNMSRIDYVTGKRSGQWCLASNCREHSCGVDARWFEPRKPLWVRLLTWGAQ